MLKQIAIADLRMGMFVSRLDASWTQHPFWKSTFLIGDTATLRKLQESGVDTCWIDTTQGEDLAAPMPAPPTMHDAAPPAQIDATTPPCAAVRASGSFARTLEQANALCESARDVIGPVFDGARTQGRVDLPACAPLVDEVVASVTTNPAALISLLRLRQHDRTSYRHSLAVCALMMAVAREYGFDEEQTRTMGLAGLLHDVGKLVLPPEILCKPGTLDEAEVRVVRTHPRRGEELLLRSMNVDPLVMDVCLHHHEKLDGSGYPERLRADALSLPARIAAACDVYDALTAVRPYKKGWDPAAAIAHMAALRGELDREVLAVLVRTLGAFPCGSLVRLASGLLAIVVEQNTAQPYRPWVLAFYSSNDMMAIDPVRINLGDGDASDRLACREPRERWEFTDLDALWADAVHRPEAVAGPQRPAPPARR